MTKCVVFFSYVRHQSNAWDLTSMLFTGNKLVFILGAYGLQ